MKLFGLDLGEIKRPRRPRSPKQYLTDISGGQAFYPLIVLFGLNAVDELDRTAFGILLPDIRDEFGLSNGGALTLVALVLLGGLIVEIPLAYYSDRLRRVNIAVGGAAVWAVFGLMTGLATTLLLLVIARTGTGIGRAVVSPTHNALLADYYPIAVRAEVYGFHRMANAVGAFIGPLSAGLLAYWFGWRAPFILFVIPTIVFVIMGLRLREPNRGRWEREAAGADAATIETEEQPPSFAESIRILWAVGTLRRIWISLPFLSASVIGFIFLTALYYEEVFGLNEAQRGLVAAVSEPAQVVGIMIGIPLASRLMARDPGLALRLTSILTVFIAAAFAVFALSPVLWLAIAMNVMFTGLAAILTPAIFASLSLAIPPKVRSMGFAMASLFIIPGALSLIVIGAIADRYGLRQGLLLVVPIFLIGGQILATASTHVKADITQVWTSTAARAEVQRLRNEGVAKLLFLRDVDVAYDGVQVLFGVDFEVDEGEIVALLGTNGAGKSTLLKSISGLVEAQAGAIIFDGRDMTYAPPHEVAARGVIQVPGGQGVFPGLRVDENLRLAGWLRRGDADLDAAVSDVLKRFPALAERLGDPAGDLSGGQQQMLTLGMAFIHRPRLLMIDELSLGLAPTVVEDLVALVRDIAASGTTVIVVEQSVNVALELAETAYFMEKGEIRFHGPTVDLLDRPDVLRSVFLEGAATVTRDTAARELESIEQERQHPRRTFDADVPPRLEVRGLTKRFGGHAALRDVDLGVAPGEILGIIGPNGAGKTTLFDAIGGFIVADEGRVTLRTNGTAHELDGLSAHRRSWLGLGRSFQDGRLFGQLSVAETIKVALERRVEVRDPLAGALHLPAVVRSEAKLDRRVEGLLELLGIGDFRDKLVRELSTGSRRVVDLACLLAHRPSVLLLDEPSSGIAQREAEALGPLLRRVRDETGASLMLVEHDVPLLLDAADRLAALDLGEVIAVGDPDVVVHDDRVVASYLGTSQVAVRGGRPGGQDRR